MAEQTLILKKTKKLKKLFSAMANAIVETLKSLIDQPLSITSGALELTDGETITSNLSGHAVVVRGALDKDFAGSTLRFLFDAKDATAVASFMMMTPSDVIDEKRKAGTLEGEDMEAFGEVGNVLCSGVDGILRDSIGSTIGLRVQDHGLVKPGLDSDGFLGEEQFLAFTYKFKVGSYPETDTKILVDLETAETWNGGPILDEEVSDHQTPAEAQKPITDEGEEPESLDSIPAHEIRGKMACYVIDNLLLETIRKSCRRVGLELDRHTVSEVPNPSAHKGDVVLLDIPIGEEKRFEYCKRMKEFGSEIKVAVLIHHPSKKRILQGFMAKADIILGWPVDEGVLSAKLNSLLAEPVPDETDDE